jgi:hypothetical protein
VATAAATPIEAFANATHVCSPAVSDVQLPLSGTFLLSGNLRAGFAGLGEPDRDGLLAAFHLFTRAAALQGAALPLAHDARYLPTRTFLFGCHKIPYAASAVA